MKFKNIYFNILLSGVFFLPILAFSQNNLGIENPISATNLWDVLISFVKIIRTLAIPFVVLAIMYTGFLFIKAQGKAEEIAAARKAFFWTMVAALIILSAQALGEMLKATILGLGQ
jgi:hypothetical protein